MNIVECSPTRSANATELSFRTNMQQQSSSSDPDLSNITQRFKRKQTDENEHIKSELAELRKQMADVITLITATSSTQTENIIKLCTDMSTVKDQVTNAISSLENIRSEQERVKVEMGNLISANNKNQERILCIEHDVQILKTTAVTNNSQASSPPNNINYEDMVHEINERNLRRRNIIISGIAEPKSSDAKERHITDRNEILSVLQSISKDIPEPHK